MIKRNRKSPWFMTTGFFSAEMHNNKAEILFNMQTQKLHKNDEM